MARQLPASREPAKSALRWNLLGAAASSRPCCGAALQLTVSMAAMRSATAYWQILALSLLSGIVNSVIHPADYSVLAGSISRARMGRAFALHTFNGNVGSVCAPPIAAALVLLVGWRS